MGAAAANVRNVSVIPARAQNKRVDETGAKKKTRVAAYARVSTLYEEQESSYEAQVDHYTRYISENPDWEYICVYADEGISATSTKNRTDFHRMINDCMEGKVDMIITKSISRFARNTLDCLKYIRQLKEKNIPVIFEKENINSLDAKGEVMLTIMASLAQHESQSISQNVKIGIAFRFQNGEVKVNHSRFLGYTKDKEKRLVIVPEEAETVKRIFREYLEGASLLQIARGLEADGKLTGAGKLKWRAPSIYKILQNEKYMGDALLAKTYTVDFLSKKRVVNNGIVPQYYVENSHEAIVPKELFMQVQEELQRRANLRGTTEGGKRVYSSKYALSSAVFCGECGDIYRRVHWNNRGVKSVVWRCVNRLEEKGSDCGSPTIPESVLHRAVMQAVNQIVADRDTFFITLKRNIETALGGGTENDTVELDARLEGLQKDLLRLSSENSEYEGVAEEIIRLQAEKQNTLTRNAERETYRQRIVDMMEFLDGQGNALTEYDDNLTRRLVERVTVYENRLVIIFRSGVEIEVEP